MFYRSIQSIADFHLLLYFLTVVSSVSVVVDEINLSISCWVESARNSYYHIIWNPSLIISSFLRMAKCCFVDFGPSYWADVSLKMKIETHELWLYGLL